MQNKHNVLPYVTAIITSFIFGFSFLFSKRALGVAEPLMLLSFRFLAAFIVMSILVALKLIKVNYKNKPVKWLILLSFIEPVIYFIFETYGLQRTASSVGGLMIALIPIAVTVLAAYLLDEKPSVIKAICIIISVSGVVLIVIMGSSKGETSSILGIALLLGAVLSAALFNIISRRISKHFSPMEITYFMMFVGAVSFNLLTVMKLTLRGKLSTYFQPLSSVTFVTSIFYLGILSSIIAYFLINYTLSKLQASTSSVFSNISTIVSIAAGVIFLRETFQVYHIIGAVLILAGVWGANYFK